jgi:hypothetical protein
MSVVRVENLKSQFGRLRPHRGIAQRLHLGRLSLLKLPNRARRRGDKSQHWAKQPARHPFKDGPRPARPEPTRCAPPSASARSARPSSRRCYSRKATRSTGAPGSAPGRSRPGTPAGSCVSQLHVQPPKPLHPAPAPQRSAPSPHETIARVVAPTVARKAPEASESLATADVATVHA